MKSIRNFYREHRVFTILMAIALVCFVLIGTIIIQCFYVGNGTDKYGNRLDGIEERKVTDEMISEFEVKVTEANEVEKTSARLQGRIIYINIDFVGNTSLDIAKSIALKSLDNFTEEYITYYDFHFTLKCTNTETSDGFLISGAKNKNGSGPIIWNNNRPTTIIESTETGE